MPPRAADGPAERRPGGPDHGEFPAHVPWRLDARDARRRREGHAGLDGRFGTLGDKLVDGGNPVSNTKTIAPGGSVSETTNPPTGYSVIKADSLDEAVELSKGCQVLQGGASVVVAETFPVM